MKAETKKELMYNNIKRHGENLNTIFNTGIEPIELCKKLLRVERKAHLATTCLMNTNTLNLLERNRLTGYNLKEASEKEIDVFFNGIEKQLVKILGEKAKDLVYINFDARGYAIKIKREKAKDLNIHKDFGGYGIIAPEF